MRFSIITPCYNAAPYIKQTINTIISQHGVQQGDTQVQVIVVDGASTDGTADIAQRMLQHATADVMIISEPDQGMYDALAKGFERVDPDADVVAYLNAGDLYNFHAFRTIKRLLTDQPQVQWLTGLDVIHNEDGQTVAATLPFRYRQKWFGCGGYLGNPLPFVQQESTFWRRDLLNHIDFDRLRTFRLAGDYYLWHTFAGHAPLSVLSAHLGGFRVHAGQQSSQLDAYIEEAQSFTGQPSPLNRIGMVLDKALWYAPLPLKQRLSDDLYHYDHGSGRWTNSRH